MSSKQLAYARIQEAITLIDIAQRNLGKACEELSPVHGLAALQLSLSDQRKHLLDAADTLRDKIVIDLDNVDLDI